MCGEIQPDLLCCLDFHQKKLNLQHTPVYGSSDLQILVLRTEYLCLPKIHRLNPNTQYDDIWKWAFRRCLDHEGGPFVVGVAPLQKGPSRDSLPLLPWDTTSKRQPSREWTSPDTKSAGAMLLDSSASKTVRNKLVIYTAPSCSILLQQPKWTKAAVNPQLKCVTWMTKYQPASYQGEDPAWVSKVTPKLSGPDLPTILPLLWTTTIHSYLWHMSGHAK